MNQELNPDIYKKFNAAIAGAVKPVNDAIKKMAASQQEVLNNSGIGSAPALAPHLGRASEIATGILRYTMQEQNEMVKAIYDAVEDARRVKIRELTDEIEALNESIKTL